MEVVRRGQILDIESEGRTMNISSLKGVVREGEPDEDPQVLSNWN